MATHFGCFSTFAVLLITSIVTSRECTRGIIKSVPEHNFIHDGGILYSFCIDENGAIYASSYGINNTANSTNYQSTELLSNIN